MRYTLAGRVGVTDRLQVVFYAGYRYVHVYQGTLPRGSHHVIRWEDEDDWAYAIGLLVGERRRRIRK